METKDFANAKYISAAQKEIEKLYQKKEKNFPNATHEEHLEMLNNFNKENNSQCIEFYEKRFPKQIYHQEV